MDDNKAVAAALALAGQVAHFPASKLWLDAEAVPSTLLGQPAICYLQSAVFSSSLWVLIGFHVFILLMMAIDLGLNRNAHDVGMKEAVGWSAVWIILAMLFACGIWKFWHLWESPETDHGSVKAIEFITGYLVELSLSVDNLFVFLVIFRYFGVPQHLRHRVLFWGIIGAVIMRALFIVVGASLLHLFNWLIYVFGVLLLYSAYKMSRSAEAEIDPGKNQLVRLIRRFFPVVDNYESPRFWVRREGRWHATPLPLVLLVVETTDVVFAMDSIPAIFGITRDSFIVYTSNIFAILGLRSLYFLLANFLELFRYLNVGLTCVLGFIGIKMIVEEALGTELHKLGLERNHLILISLAAVTVILSVSMIASLIAGPTKALDLPADEAEEIPESTSTDDAKS